jgi:hypothetical protein
MSEIIQYIVDHLDSGGSVSEKTKHFLSDYLNILERAGLAPNLSKKFLNEIVKISIKGGLPFVKGNGHWEDIEAFEEQVDHKAVSLLAPIEWLKENGRRYFIYASNPPDHFTSVENNIVWANVAWLLHLSQKEKRSNMETDELTVTVEEVAGGRDITAELPGNVVMNRLLPALIEAMNLSSDAEYDICHKQSGKKLQNNDTLIGIGVKDGDTLRLSNTFTAGGVVPIRSINDILITDSILSRIESEPPIIGAILLYTEWDVTLAEFIRNDIDEVDELAGQHCNVFVIEEPTERWIAKNKDSLKREIRENFDFLWKRLDWASSKPYNKSEAIEIARRFLIEPEDLPAVILFNSGNDKDYLLISLNNILPDITDDVEQDYRRFFRKFFSLTSRASKYPAEIRLTMLERMVNDTWKPRQKMKNHQALRELARQISLEVSVTDIVKTVLSTFGNTTP